MPENKIPVLAVVGASLRRVLLHLPQVLWVLAPYWLTSIVLVLAQSFIAKAMIGGPLQPVFMLTLAALILTVLAQQLHVWLRATLFGRKEALAPTMPSTFFKFLLRFATLQITIVVVPLTLVAGLFAPEPAATSAGDIGALIVWMAALVTASLIIVYFWLRLGLVLPAIAANHPLGFGQAWKLSAGNGLRMVAVTVVVALCCFVALLPCVAAIVSLAPPFEGPGSNPWMAALIPYFVVSLLIHLGGAILTSALAYYYKILTGHPEPLAILK
jgi:hypothetical protein